MISIQETSSRTSSNKMVSSNTVEVDMVGAAARLVMESTILLFMDLRFMLLSGIPDSFENSFISFRSKLS